jgi:high-affinity iron transporter
MVLASFLVTSRETLEAALVIGIVMAYLTKTNRHEYKKTVYYGIIFGIIASLLAAVLFSLFAGGFSGTSEAIFEGSTMLVGAFLLTTMILWMIRQKHIAIEIQNKVSNAIEKADLDKTYAYGIFFLILVAVLREGVETVIFLNAMRYASGVHFIGGTLGILVAIGIGYLFFNSARNINLKKFFNISSILLILFSAGLVAHGVHELQEAAVIPTVVEHVWNTNFIINENGLIGSFMKGLFGYNSNPSLIEILSYAAYLGLIFYLYRRIENSNKVIS